MEQSNLDFGKEVKLARARLGISQETLGGMADLHRTYVSDIERGSRNPTLSVMVRLADALGLRLSTLVEFHKPPKSHSADGHGGYCT